ncbi:MAG: hypothetical protein KBI47_09375, partial [Armatimonadetes bacterium]|nr:hypothetical protein [Armatimonadota bacterium]
FGGDRKDQKLIGAAVEGEPGEGAGMEKREHRYLAAGGVFAQSPGIRGAAGHISPEVDKGSCDVVVEENVAYLFGAVGVDGLEVKGLEGACEGFMQRRWQVHRKHRTW